MADASAYVSMLQGLLPSGKAWTRDPNSNLSKVLGFIASELAILDGRTQDLLNEADPRATLEMLSDWENDAGLPDICTSLNTTLQERRQALTNRITMLGGQSKAFFISIAASLGYTITITTYNLFVCGLSRCDDTLNGGPTNRYIWTVNVPNPRLTYFRTGASECGEALMSVARAADLECVLQQLQPAHTQLVFNYGGV